jgi:hypothetical protein
MRASLQFILAAVLGMIVLAGTRPVAAAPSKTLVFEGTVVSIGTVDHPQTPWLVTVNVTKVVTGELSGSTFEFLVHSPALSGLEKGRSYTIEAVWEDNGYIVDEDQWRRPKRRTAEPGLSVESRADKPRGDTFRDIAAIEKWAKQSYFGGAVVTKYSKEDRELVAVNGMPTSGLLTSQVLVLGRAAGNPEYHVILKSAVFVGDLKVRQQKDGLAVDATGKTVFYVPFDLASLVVHTGL